MRIDCLRFKTTGWAALTCSRKPACFLFMWVFDWLKGIRWNDWDEFSDVQVYGSKVQRYFPFSVPALVSSATEIKNVSSVGLTRSFVRRHAGQSEAKKIK